MHQTKKNEQWFFGMKLHIGADSKTGLAHRAVVTAANVHDKHPLPNLLHGQEDRVYGDCAYASQQDLIHSKAPDAADWTNQKVRKGSVPGQYSSGGKARLGKITKAGDPYLRSLLVMGAKAVLNAARSKTDGLSRWATALQERRGYWRAVVAIAAKNARMAWAVLRRGEAFVLPA